MDEIQRLIEGELIQSSRSYPVITVLGPRQSGKTTVVQTVFPEKPYVSLEDPDIRAFASNDPRGFLKQYANGAIFDEIQRVPVLLSYLQGMVDEKDEPGQFILTGSHQPLLQQEISQSLAGRTAVLHLLPLSLEELGKSRRKGTIDEQILYGFYPRIYKYAIEPQRFYRDYVRTYLERDLKLILNIKDLDQFQRFISLCATRIGQTIDYTHLSNELGISRLTVTEWISILKASFIITTLPPYFENLGKRIIKSSKLYFNDIGLACYLLGIRTAEQVSQHPFRGALFENLVILEIMKHFYNRGDDTPLYFYRDSNGTEIDVVFQKGIKLIAIEIKSSSTFNINFLKNLNTFAKLDETKHIVRHLIYAGTHEQSVNGTKVVNVYNLEFLGG